jgi:hypothetical protein
LTALVLFEVPPAPTNTRLSSNIQRCVASDDKPLPVSTSVQPTLPPAQLACFCEVLSLMNEWQLPYVVSGAFALQEHTGIFRDTKDLDLFCTAETASKALAKLATKGYEIEVTDPLWLAKARKGDFFVDFITGMSNGIVKVDPSWIERAHPEKVLGVPSRVLAPEELIASKVFVDFRERFDGADIVHVIFRTKGKLDWNRLFSLLDGHTELLFWHLVLFHYVYPAHSRYVPHEIWDELIENFTRELSEPDPKARFRGSLLDERMFAIDVANWGLADLLKEERAAKRERIVAPQAAQQTSDPDSEAA